VGYLIALAVIGFYAFAFSSKSPQTAIWIIVIGWGIIGLIRLQSLHNEAEAKKRREEEVERRRTAARENFAKLGIKVIADDERRPWAFASEYDAKKFIGTKSYSLVSTANSYFVVNAINLDDQKRAVISTSLTEFFNVDRYLNDPRREIRFVKESHESLDYKKQIQEERESQRKKLVEIRMLDIERRTKEDVGSLGSALYFMHSKHGVKVGISDDPESRLRQIQTGHPSKVELRKAIWFFSKSDAAAVEKMAHQVFRLRGTHTSGEWFDIKLNEAFGSVTKIVKELIETGKVDTQIADLRSRRSTEDIELSLAQLTSLTWKISQKGNEWLRFDGKTVTVFRRGRGWSFVFNEQFSEEMFDSKANAKLGALQKVFEYLQSVQKTVPDALRDERA
jgi:hypothetical protein